MLWHIFMGSLFTIHLLPAEGSQVGVLIIKALVEVMIFAACHIMKALSMADEMQHL
jgi:hypothetical protein